MRARHSLALLVTTAACSFAIAAGSCGVAARPAQAFPNPLKPLCSGAGLVSGVVGKACNIARHGGRLLKAGGKLLSGHPGAALKTALGEGAGNLGAKATAAIGIAAVVAWVTGGARFVLRETSKVISETTAPQLNSTWFSGAYWRMTAIAALLALPFLFAAAVQALMRSDLTLILRAAFGYLPLAMLSVAIAAPLAMLLLAASD